MIFALNATHERKQKQFETENLAAVERLRGYENSRHGKERYFFNVIPNGNARFSADADDGVENFEELSEWKRAHAREKSC